MKKSRLRKIGPPIGFFVSRKFAKLRPTRDDNAVFWKGGREVECAGLEIRYTVIPYRGFESLPFRQRKLRHKVPDSLEPFGIFCFWRRCSAKKNGRLAEPVGELTDSTACLFGELNSLLNRFIR